MTLYEFSDPRPLPYINCIDGGPINDRLGTLTCSSFHDVSSDCYRKHQTSADKQTPSASENQTTGEDNSAAVPSLNTEQTTLPTVAEIMKADDEGGLAG